MKLKLLVVAAGIGALPLIAGAQTPKDTTKKDTTMSTMSTGSSTSGSSSSGSSMSGMSSSSGTSSASAGMGNSALPEQSVNGPRPVPPSDGTTCPWKCPTSKGVAGLTGPQFLALQQELRDKGCGTNHVTGVLDGATRHAISVCAKKLGVKNTAAAVLVAMNIGYSASDVQGSGTED
jgi:hypothetical protein